LAKTLSPVTLEQLRGWVDRMPFNQLLGIRVAKIHADGVTIECKVRDELRNLAGLLHGGVTATMADAAVGISIASHFRGARRTTTVEMKLNYLRPIAEGKAIARAHLLRIGAHLCVGRVDIFDSKRNLAATALVTYMLLEGEPVLAS
jgi:uncharacterized protein (TIGR00369 family)